MTAYPVHFHVEKPEIFTRVQLVVRLLAFLLLGMLGLSLGLIFVAAYLVLPAFAAARLVNGRSADEYLAEEGARLGRALQWFAAVTSWFGLVTDKLPTRSPAETLELTIVPSGRPTASGALWRLILGLPSALVLALLGVLGGLVWLWAALTVLFARRVGDTSFWFLAGMQRWSVRLLAWQASLVEPYPPFSLDEGHPVETAGQAPA